MMNGNGGGPVIRAPSGPRMLYRQDDRQSRTDNQERTVLTLDETEAPYTRTVVRPGASLAAFSAVSVADVVTAIAGLPDKSSAADPLSVPLMKQVACELGPFLTELFNRFFAVWPLSCVV